MPFVSISAGGSIPAIHWGSLLRVSSMALLDRWKSPRPSFLSSAWLVQPRMREPAPESANAELERDESAVYKHSWKQRNRNPVFFTNHNKGHDIMTSG